MTTALISADNHWMLIAIMFLSTAIAICLEHKYSWAAKMSGAIITLIIAVFWLILGLSQPVHRCLMMWSGDMLFLLQSHYFF